jgi:hypothetical protein
MECTSKFSFPGKRVAASTMNSEARPESAPINIKIKTGLV